MNNLQIQFQLARQAYARGDYQKVVTVCDQTLLQAGGNPDVLNLKALALLALGQYETAETVISRALKRSPRDASLHLNAALIFQGLSKYRLVKRHAREAIRHSPREAPVLYQAALMFRNCGDLSRALRILDRCIDLQPEFSHALHLKGSVLIDSGDFQAARQCLERAVAAQPDNVRALSDLLRVRGDRLADSDAVDRLEHIRQGHTPPVERATAVFALADLHRADGQSETAFEYYREANAIMAGVHRFDLPAWEQRITRIMQSTRRERFKSREGNGGSNLVFIIGMPRSGTSLVEQVLSAHPGVLACGELATMQQTEAGLERRGHDTSLLQAGQTDQDSLYTRAAELYLSALPTDHRKCTCVTDKAPTNFERVGLIHQVFPGARFLHCTRHPLDIILSCYFQNFQAGMPFAFDLEHITRIYLGQVRIMRHWRRVLPRYIHNVNYESLTSDLETETRAIADFLGLEFTADLLSPHRQKRAVATASSLQVRKPVYTSSIGNWKNYRQPLGAVIKLLQQQGILDADCGLL